MYIVGSEPFLGNSMTLTFEKFVSIAISIVGILLICDIWADWDEGATIGHISIEITAFLFCSVIALKALSSIWNYEREKSSVLQTKLNSTEIERNKWREEAKTYLHGLSTAIDKQFLDWGFTESEKEIGLLILKGLSHKEIATIRNTSEKTVRQQAATLYGKAGLAGKSELFAFFLEDLLTPSTST